MSELIKAVEFNEVVNTTMGLSGIAISGVNPSLRVIGIDYRPPHLVCRLTTNYTEPSPDDSIALDALQAAGWKLTD